MAVLNACPKVPPPRKFPRTSGGARSIAIHIEPRATNHVHFSPAPSSIPNHSIASPAPSSIPGQHATSPTPEPSTRSTSNPPQHQHRRQHRRNSKKDSGPIFGVGAEEFRSSRPSKRCIYPQSKLRGFTTIRKVQLVCL